ncbi:MAG TPA: hypothetical protein DC049_09445 [Spirochaetia bacterium]|nr:hypothetical protein [Spirochaetia bacterium]
MIQRYLHLFLKSLQIIGFKSFAEKTHLEFNNGITALVGPNGGGKSNIVDAIRWALGEQSARILRADKMEDLIFNGNEDRPRSNFAEVEITLVTENSILPVEYNEISITRRLYRSGESEYLLNKNPVKLKDINVLFMDTGVGKAAYSIIGQGKIDQMISEKPEERRIIFDEAASITKYRARIREYESKLADTREHLTRIDISLKEKEKQYNLLKNQAERTNLYFAISETMKNAEIDYDLYKIQKFKNEKEKVDSRLVQLTRDIDSLSEDVNKIAEEINSITGIIKSREYDATQMEKNTITLEGKISTATNRLLIFRENINDIGQNIVISENRSRETAARLERFQAEIMRLEKEITENTGKIENFLAQNQALILKKTGLETEIEKLREEIHNRKRRNFEIDNMRSSLEEKHKIIINELIQELDNLKNAVSSQKAAGDEERQKLGIMGGRLKELSGFLKNIDFSALSGTDFSARKDEITSLLAEFCTASESFIDLSSGIIGKKDPFQELVFSAEGAYAKKEEIDASLLSLDAEKTQNAENIDSMEKLVRTHQKSIEDHNAEAGRNEVQMAALNENLRISDKTRTEHLKEAEACREEIAKIDSGLKDLAARRQELENKIIEEG